MNARKPHNSNACAGATPHIHHIKHVRRKLLCIVRRSHMPADTFKENTRPSADGAPHTHKPTRGSHACNALRDARRRTHTRRGGGGGDARAAAAAASTTTHGKCPVTRRTCSTRAPWQAPCRPRDQSRCLHARRDCCGEHPADIARRHDTSAVARHPRHPHQSTCARSTLALDAARAAFAHTAHRRASPHIVPQAGVTHH